MVIGGVSRAAPKVEYTLPHFGLNCNADEDTIFFSAFNAGFEFRR